MNVERAIAALPGKTEAERGKMRDNAARWLATGTSAQQADARKLLEALDAATLSDRQKLKDRPLSARVAEAFHKRPPTPNEEKIIRALLENPHSTSGELTSACGFDGLIWQMHFGNMAKAREADLWPAEYSDNLGAPFYCGILAGFDENGNRFTMKPEAVMGFAAIGIAARPARRTEGT